MIFSLMMNSCAAKDRKPTQHIMTDMNTIYFAGGCFWGTEHFMKQINGVVSTQAGYANSRVANPSYREVC